MPFAESAGISYFQFELLSQTPVIQAVFTRRGGVSKGSYAELNVGALVGDEPEYVAENITRSFAAMGRPRSSMFDSWLVHGAQALVAGAPRPPEWGRPPQGDIILTNKPEVSLFMRYADCVPLVYVDPVKKALGLAHAGWRGTLLRVAGKAVEEMQRHYGSRPEDLLVGIGPAISVDHYEVGPGVVSAVQDAFASRATALLPEFDGKPHFDLVAANRLVLADAGVRMIEQADLCTYSNPSDWFSHRASAGKTGRFGALLALA
jgi:YfiH family protein